MAVERRDLLYIVLSHLEASLLAGDALSRRTLQDLVFVAQSWDLPLDYEFTFSLKGPFSNELVPEILQVQQKMGSYERRTRFLKLKPDLGDRLTSLKGFVEPLMEDRRRLHIIACVMFLGQRYRMTRREIVDYFQRFAPEYFPFEISEIVDQVNDGTPVHIH